MSVVPLYAVNGLCPDRSTLAAYLRRVADEVERGDTDTERVYVVHETRSGDIVLDIAGSAGATNAHVVGIFHIAAQKVMQP